MMTPNDYGVRVMRAWSNMRVGNVIYPPSLLRDSLVKGGFVERIEAPEPESVEEEPKERKAVRK